MKFRMISASVLALVVGLAVVAPVSALAQNGVLFVATDTGVFVPAADHQFLRVTIGNPSLPGPSADGHFRESSFSIELTGAPAPVTIGPGESYTFVLDPREVGVLVDTRTGLRHVMVGYRFTATVVEDQSAPRPAVTIEIVNRRSGVVESFHAFPGFSGGVVVAG